MASSPYDKKNESAAQIIDRLCDEFEAAWRGGQPPDWREFRERGRTLAEDTQPELLTELFRVDCDFRRRLNPDFDIAEHARALGFPADDASVRSIIAFFREVTPSPPLPHIRLTPTSEQGARRIGKFLIEKEIGRGGFGIVYLARDETLDRTVALKIPHTHLTGEIRQRFLTEARAAANLDHPGIVPVYEAAVSADECYIAAAYCPGQTLADWLKSDRNLTWQSAAMIASRIAEAAACAHEQGVVHRDLKPANLMLTPEDYTGDPEAEFRIRITDFGLAKLLEQTLEDTNSSIMLGTPGYMAPEQLDRRRDSADPRMADIYSIGVILYELTTGRPPLQRAYGGGRD